jgi:hypothetical protein
MDDAHFRALIGDLSLTADIRLSDSANRSEWTWTSLMHGSAVRPGAWALQAR